MKNVSMTKFSNKRLAEMWCEMNAWKIPEELKEEIQEPILKELSPYMGTIMKMIGKDACLKKWREIHCKDEEL